MRSLDNSATLQCCPAPPTPQAEAHSLRNELDAAKLSALRQQEAVAAAEAAAAVAQQQLEAQREGEGVLQVGAAVG